MTTAARSRFLDLRALAKLEHTRFSTRQRVEGSYGGRHRSRQQGGAGEFADFREYSPGEDLRRLDWKVLGRSGRSYLRLYQDETNLLCTLAIDASGSMRFGEHSRDGAKLQYVQYLATALSHIISCNLDQVGTAVLTDKLDEYVPVGANPSHVLRVQEVVERIKTRPTTTMAGGLLQLFQRSGRRGVLMLVSDFLMDDLEATFAALRLFRHAQSEVVVLHIVHPDEERLPGGTAYRFEGLENEGTVDCSPADIEPIYAKRFEAHLANVRNMALAIGCDYRLVSTRVPYLQTLGQFLLERSG